MTKCRCLLYLSLACLPNFGWSADWLSWRGPLANGVAADQPAPPAQFGVDQNVVWKTAVPGRGHSSPIVVGSLVLLTTADEQNQIQFVLAYDRQTGVLRWQRELHRGSFNPKIHAKNTHASPTLASDGRYVYASFNNDRRVQVSKLDLAGNLVWKRSAGPYLPQKYQFGYAPSPLLYRDVLIVAADFEDNGYLVAIKTSDGSEVWRTRRPSQISYSSPIVGRTGGRDQLLISGAAQVASYDPATGERLWSAPVTAPATCGTMVWSERAVFASGGYPKRETAAVASDGSGRVLWRNDEKCYEQSLLYHDGQLYAVNDKGIAFCWDAATGEERWKQRLEGGAVSSSPTLIGDLILVGNERGTFYAFRATPAQFTPVAKSQLGDEAFASPAVVDGRIYLRTASRAGGSRQETLYCIGSR